MDADLFSSPTPSRPSSVSPGGAVESARRVPTASPPPQASGERFEMRDRFADVIHRAGTFSEMAAKADQLGSTLFVAVDADGRRTSIQKVDGEWQRGPQRPASTSSRSLPAAPVAPMPVRREEPEASEVQSEAPTARTAAQTDARPRQAAKAERALLVAKLEAALTERYIIRPAPVTFGAFKLGHTEYRFRGDSTRLAFTESTLRLATDINSPFVARSMVDVAQARSWRALRVSGHEDFKRLVWLEASVRGLKILGYEPSPQDLALLDREREARLVNRIEPAAAAVRSAGAGVDAAPGEKASERGGGGRSSVLAAVQALLVARNVPESQHAAVMAAATEKLAQLTRQGLAPRIKIYDITAPSHAVAVPAPEMQRAPERAAPTPRR